MRPESPATPGRAGSESSGSAAINLDRDPADVLELGAPRRPPRRWVPWLAAGVAVLVAAGLAAHARFADGTPTARPTSSATSQRAGVVIAPSAPSISPGSGLRQYASPLVPNTTGAWELVVLGRTSIERILFARKQAYVTPVSRGSGQSAEGLVALPDAVVYWPTEAVDGLLVPDSGAPGPVTGATGLRGPALRGPRPGTFWAGTGTGQIALLDSSGRSLEEMVAVPDGMRAGPFEDGAGQLVVNAVGGVYELRTTGARRVSTGSLIAAGPTRYLVVECDEAAQCQVVVINRSTGARLIAGSGYHGFGQFLGRISPDGRTAALVGYDDPGTTQLKLLDLETGASHQIPVAVDASPVWSPDGQWLFLVGQLQVMAVNPASGVVTRVPVDVTGPSGLAIRT